MKLNLTIRLMKFKDYEYGWYGFHGNFSSKFYGGQAYHNQYQNNIKCMVNKYTQHTKNTFKQLKFLSDVCFVVGEYYEVI